MNSEENNKVSPLQKFRLYLYIFFHLFTYKSYGKYLKGIRLAHALIGITIVCLFLTPLFGKEFFSLSLCLAYIAIGLIIIVTLRGKPIEKSSRILTNYFELKKRKLHLRVFDYDAYNAETKEAHVLFNLFPETNNLIMFCKLIVKLLKKEKISYSQECFKIKQIIKFLKHNPENKSHDKYTFFLNLPDKKDVFINVEKDLKKQGLKLKEVSCLTPIRPIQTTSLYYTGVAKLKWKLYQIY